MIAFISIFMPAILAVVAFNWNRKLEANKRIYFFIEYIIAVLAINMFNIVFLRILKHYSGNLSEDLNKYTIFAFEYIVLSLFLGVVVPYLFVIDGGIIKISFNCRKNEIKPMSDRTWHIIAVIYGALLLGFCLTRLFDNYFWGDETYSIMMAKMSMADMLSTTATDVHPPLYYMLLMLLYRLFGDYAWVYHLSAFLPYLCIIVIALTVVWKRFGKETAFLLITFSSFLNQSVIYNVEVRMYSLAELAILVAFLELLPILKKNTLKRHYVVFVVFSLIAAYSHYYALVAVAFFYLAIIVEAFYIKDKRKAIFGISAITVVLYIPWLIMILGNIRKSCEDFWLTDIPSINQCLLSFFEIYSKKYTWFIEGLYLLILVIGIGCIIKECGVLVIKKNGKRFEIIISNQLKCLEIDTIWILCGYLAVIGTLLFGIVVSKLIRPALLVRYLFPTAIIVWLSIGILIRKISSSRIRGVVAGIIVIATIGLCAPEYYDSVVEERYKDSICEETRSVLCEKIAYEDNIVTDSLHLYRTVLRYYVPAKKYENWEFDNFTDSLYWLIWDRKMTEQEELYYVQKGYAVTSEYEDGLLGDIPIYLYKLSRNSSD